MKTADRAIIRLGIPNWDGRWGGGRLEDDRPLAVGANDAQAFVLHCDAMDRLRRHHCIELHDGTKTGCAQAFLWALCGRIPTADPAPNHLCTAREVADNVVLELNVPLRSVAEDT